VSQDADINLQLQKDHINIFQITKIFRTVILHTNYGQIVTKFILSGHIEPTWPS